MGGDMTRNWGHAAIADDRHAQQRTYCPVGDGYQVLRPSLHDERSKDLSASRDAPGPSSHQTTDHQYALVIHPTSLRGNTHGGYEALSRPSFVNFTYRGPLDDVGSRS